MPPLPDQVDNGPMIFALLEIMKLKLSDFSPA